MKKTLRTGGCLLLGALAAWALPWTMALREPAEARARMTALCVASLCFYGGMNALLNAALHAAPDSGNILFSVPAQQIAAAVNSQPERISKEERAALEELFPSGVLEKYTSFLADPVKDKLSASALRANPARYADLYLSIGRKCPGSYLSAALALNCGLW